MTGDTDLGDFETQDLRPSRASHPAKMQMLLLVGALGVALRTPPPGVIVAPRRSAVRLQHAAAAAASAWGGALTSHDPQTVPAW